MSATYFSRKQRLRRVQLDLLLMEVFGERYLPNEVAMRIAQRRDHEVSFIGGVNRAMARQERAEARWGTLVGVS